LQVAAGVSILGLVAWGCFTYTSVAESSEHGSAMAKDQQLEQQLWGVQSPLYGATPAYRARQLCATLFCVTSIFRTDARRRELHLG
jgi:hypothetical protein